MTVKVEDIEDQSKYRQILTVAYNDFTGFVLDYLRRGSGMTVLYWSVCLIFHIPGLWKWSLSLFLFVHTTMCAGDFYNFSFASFSTSSSLTIGRILKEYS